MIRDLGVQLYSLREGSARDFSGALKFVAETGCKAVAPAEMVRRFASRTVSLHLRDGTFESDRGKRSIVNGKVDRNLKLRPLGTGTMDIPAVVAAAPESVDTLIVEPDCCVIDMREALKQGYDYLTENRPGVGNK